mmetsp:Transcript_20824/g.65483  ORF Transcript_20824/g.65483 Transcript_20824/m.65483 type:complete len:673 (+) Transcript_20824:42-2060(+)
MAVGSGMVVGLDLGAESSMVVLESGEIVRNELGGHSSASLVGFGGRERLIGEAGVAQLTTNSANTVRVGEWLSGNTALRAHRPYTEVEGRLRVEYGKASESSELGLEAATGALLRKLGSLVSGGEFVCAVAVPASVSEAQRSAIATGLEVAKLRTARGRELVRSDRALCAVYAAKHGVLIPEGESRVVAIVDIGRCTASAAVGRFQGGGYELLSSASSQSAEFGTAALDAALYEVVAARYPAAPARGSKKARRLLSCVEKIRKLLSTMSEASASCENFLEDRDISVVVTRDEFREACGPLLASLKTLLETTAVVPVDAVELVGGGCRVAIVREVVADVFGTSEFGAKLDDASLAHGAALVAADAASPDEYFLDAGRASDEGDGSPERVAELVAAEDAMCRRDEALAAAAERRNALETRILELRAARNGPRGALFPAEFGAELDALETWLFEQEDDADFAAKLAELETAAREACPDYFAALEADKAARDEALEAAAAEAVDDDERREDRLDADTRRLKFSDRFRLVEKNKNEGSELFKGGNFRHAAKRYKDALAHAAKLTHDLTPDQQLQTKRVKIDLNINISLCWTKLDNLEQSLRSCDEALKLDDANPKALYRRAYALENLKRYDDAKQDVLKALQAVPDDKAILQLQKRIDAQLARQKKKEKAMWGKAFA